MSLMKLLFGSKGGPTLRELESLSERTKFSSFLPWIAYDPVSKLYVNFDETVGYIWECTPLCFAGSKTVDILEGIFRIGFPEGSIVQFILHADDYIEPFIDAFRSCKTRNNPLVKSTAEAFGNFLLEGRKGLSNLQGIPLRNFRLFVAVKMPAAVKDISGANLQDLYNTTEELLRGARLYPRPFSAEDLVDWARRLLNDGSSMNNSHLDDALPIAKQVIFSDTVIRKDYLSVYAGGKIFRCTTPKVFPKEVDAFQTNQLFGGIWGVVSDTDQIKTPFFYSLNIIMQNMKTRLHTKCNLVLQQQGAGSFAPSLARKKEEYLWAVDELEKGKKFFRIIPTFWVYDRDDQKVSEAISRVKRIWESQGYVMQEDRGIVLPLFIASLPFGFYNKGRNIDMLDRDFIVPTDTIASLLPVQGDFTGGGAPVLQFAGRKGQICGMDIFHKEGVSNNNAFITAPSGGGKSFFINYLAYNYWANNALIRIIDIGGSYKKQVHIANAVFLDFSKESNICINPFTHIADEPEKELSAIAAITGQMVYSSTPGAMPTEVESTLLKNAARWAWNTKGRDADIDTIYTYLRYFPKYAEDLKVSTISEEELIKTAQMLAYNLTDFTSAGVYGKYFNGRSTFDISQDEFVVLELEHLKPQKDLFKVITLMVINAVTQDLYLSDRSRHRLIIFDEAWQFVNEGAVLGEVIEEGYRRARKYGGSFTIVTQSLLDLENFGSIGDVIRANSAFRFYGASPDFEKAKDKKLIDYDEFTMQLLKSVASNRPKYSELFVDTPFGMGAVRLAVDPFSYYVFTSDAEEVAEIETMVKKQGISYEDAIKEMVRRYRSP